MPPTPRLGYPQVSRQGSPGAFPPGVVMSIEELQAAGRVMPATWTEAGWAFGRDGLLYVAEWRRGLTPHELRATWYQVQRVAALEAQARQLRRDLEASEAARDRAEASAWWYRRQVVLEARLGLALARIAA